MAPKKRCASSSAGADKSTKERKVSSKRADATLASLQAEVQNARTHEMRMFVWEEMEKSEPCTDQCFCIAKKSAAKREQNGVIHRNDKNMEMLQLTNLRMPLSQPKLFSRQFGEN